MNFCTITLTQELNSKLPLEIQDVFSCYSIAAKNIRNKTLFLISNIQSSYVYNTKSKLYTLKDKLHINEQNVIRNANSVVELINAKSLHKSQKNNVSVNTKTSTKKTIELKLFSNTIDQKTFFQSINKSFIENLVRFVEQDLSDDRFKDYTILNSVLAQNVVQKVCDDFAHYSKSLSAYFKNPDNFKSIPQKPSYKDKHDLSSFEVSSLRLNNNGSILTINKNHKLFFDFKKQKQLTNQNTIKFYNNFDFRSLIEQDIKDKNLHVKYSKELKITLLRVLPAPYSKHKFKLQYTISFPMELKGYYSDIIKDNPEFLEEKDHVKYKIIKNFIDNQVNTSKVIPNFASMDLGHVNIASIYYFNGLNNIGFNKADIVSAKNFITRINKLDNKIDKQKQNLYNSNNKVDKLTLEVLTKIENNRLNKEFNKNLADGLTAKPMEVITKQDRNLLIAHSKKIYADKLIRQSTYRKSNITKDYLHKLSKQIVDNLVSKGINLLIIGKNKEWKQEINIGTANNRRAYNLPHSKLIELLKYKCMLKNILIIEQEESYTSKISFSHNEEMPEYRKERKTQGKKSQFKSQDQTIKREGQKLYESKSGRKTLICHADLNGAMNIARKLITEFNINSIRKNNDNKDIYGYSIVSLCNYAVTNSMLKKIV